MANIIEIHNLNKSYKSVKTGLIRNHMLGGTLREIKNAGVNNEVISMIQTSFDSKLTFFNKDVSLLAMYLVVCLTTLALIGLFLLLNFIKKRQTSHTKKRLSKW